MEYIRTNIIGILVVVVGLLVVTNIYTVWTLNTGFNELQKEAKHHRLLFAVLGTNVHDLCELRPGVDCLKLKIVYRETIDDWGVYSLYGKPPRLQN